MNQLNLDSSVPSYVATNHYENVPHTEWIPPQLRPWWNLPGLTDFLINGPTSAWVDQGSGLTAVPLRLSSPAEVREIAVHLAGLGGQRLDDALPMADARLPDGTRFHGVLPPVSGNAPLISLRRIRAAPFTLPDLQARGMIAPVVGQLLLRMVARRLSILISGATGAGKTTLLMALLSAVSARERIVVIEEAGEITAQHPHLVHLYRRLPNVAGQGEVSLTRLVQEALRMRPDRIVLGECRGAEIREVLTALNTGHPGSLTTVHANSLADVPQRLVSLGALADLSGEAVLMQAEAAFQVVVQVENLRQRQVTQLGMLVDLANGALATSPGSVTHFDLKRWQVQLAVSISESGEAAPGPAWPFLERLLH